MIKISYFLIWARSEKKTMFESKKKKKKLTITSAIKEVCHPLSGE